MGSRLGVLGGSVPFLVAMVKGLGFRVGDSGLGFRVWDLGCRVWGLGFRIRVRCSGLDKLSRV